MVVDIAHASPIMYVLLFVPVSNIMRKSNIVSLDALYARGDEDTPVRIRIA